MNMARWSVRNRVAVNLFTIVLLIAGFVSGTQHLKLDLFPEITTNWITVATLDFTTSVPEDIERTITVPIEEELTEVEGILRMTSLSQDNFSRIFIELEASITDVDPVLNEVRQAVDKARAELPRSAEPPLVQKFDLPNPIITFTVSYPPGYDVREIRPALDRIERRLKITPGVSEVLIDGLPDREIWVEVDPFRADVAGVSMAEIVAAVAQSNLNIVGGRIDGEGGQRIVRLLGQIDAAGQLDSLVLRAGENGGPAILLRDVATTKETTMEPDTLGRVNLLPAITFSLIKKKGSDAIEAVELARKVFATEAALLPDVVETQVVNDMTRFVKTRIATVSQNGIQALLLVTFLLMFLLNWRLALVVAFGLPVSFAGTFLVMYFMGESINLLSLFAMIMALGMVVDDAVVVSENVFRFYQKGESPSQAAIKGTQEVIWPVLGSVSTTVAAFLPLIWGEGIIGKFLAIVPIVVISALVFSLLQAFLVLPSHLADFVRLSPSTAELSTQASARPPRGLRWITWQISITYSAMRELVDDLLNWVIGVYLHLLTMALRLRYLVVVGFVASLLGMAGAVKLGVIRFELFATDFADAIIVKLELPADSSLEQTEDIVARLEKRIVETLPASELVALLSRVGTRLGVDDTFLENGSNLAMITVDIDEQNPDARRPSVIERDLRNLLLEFPEFTDAVAKAQAGGPPVGRPVNAEVQGPDFAVLQEIAGRLEAHLRTIDGVTNIGNDFPRGKTEFRVLPDDARIAAAGLNVASVGEALQGAFRGIEATTFRRGNDEVTIRVKLADRFANDPAMLEAYRIKNQRGEMIEIGTIADIERSAGISRIQRKNQERIITVSGDVDDRVTTSTEVNAKLAEWVPSVIAEYPGYRVVFTGENEDTQKSIAAMVFAAQIAMLLIYALLATITNSFLQPFVIMAVIPFAFVGVLIGLVFMGEPMGLMSVMGTIALAGIVVNNSVVFVDFINRFRHAHLKNSEHAEEENERLQPRKPTSWARWSSIMRSGRTRFRPIFLTTATTVVGLMGLAFTTTGQEQFLAPMAQAVVWGLSFATLVTMVLIPCLYAILDDLRNLAFRKRA